MISPSPKTRQTGVQARHGPSRPIDVYKMIWDSITLKEDPGVAFIITLP
jgi:hypothetical protein